MSDDTAETVEIEPVGADPETELDPSEPRRFSVGGQISRGEWWAMAAIGTVYLLLAVLIVKVAGVLGWDESVYALRGQEFFEGTTPGRYWQDYRAPGLPWVAHLGWIQGPTVAYVRMVAAGFGLGLLAVTWLVTRYLFGIKAGLVAAAGLAVTPPVLHAATRFWPDVPGAALGLTAIALLMFATNGKRASWWVLGVPIAVAGATYLRYGAPMPMLIGFGVVLWWRRKMIRKSIVPLGIAGLLSVGLVVAIQMFPVFTGSREAPFKVIQGRGRSWFQGFFDYIEASSDLFGAAVVLAIIGFVAAAVWAFRGEIDRTRFLVAGVTAVATTLVLATILHGELRYLSPALPWLWIGAAPGLVMLAEKLPSPGPVVAAVVVGLLLVPLALDTARGWNREYRQDLSVAREAAIAIRDDAAGERCLVVTSRVTQVRWYSGCDATNFNLKRMNLPDPRNRRMYLMLLEGDRRSPDGELRREYVDATQERMGSYEHALRDAVVYIVSE